MTLLTLTAGAALAQGTPQPIPALLPDKTTIPAGPATPIDGMWRVDAVSARIRIEGGRIYALDPWIHLFVMQINPGMVVVRNFERTGPGEYKGDDLPLLGPLTASLNDNQQLVVHVKGKLGPVDLTYTSLQPDDPAAFRQERADQLKAGGGGP